MIISIEGKDIRIEESKLYFKGIYEGDTTVTIKGKDIGDVVNRFINYFNTEKSGKIASTDLKALRNAKGYTQQEMANMLGMTSSNYCCYERGRYPSRRRDIEEDISAILDCEYKYIYNSR